MSEQVKKTKAGLKWSVIDQVVRQFVTLFISAILSRLVTPAEYGLLAMVTVVIGFLQVFRDFGLGASVIQKQNISTKEQSAIFWLNVLMGVVLTVILLITAPLIAAFFNEPALTILIRFMSINFVVGSLAIVPEAIILKSVDFKSYFFRNLISVLTGGLVGILLALLGFGVWALVWQTVVTSTVSLVANFAMIRWRPGLIFSTPQIKSHLRFSLPLFGDSFINYWVRNVDNLLVGKLLGAAPLGIYMRAYSLMLLPVRQISATISRVMFPSFSLIQEKDEEIWHQYTTMVSFVSTISFPLMAILGVYAKEVISIVYGSAWMEVVPVFKGLCILGALQAIASLSGSVFSAKGKTLLMFKVGIFAKSCMIAGIVTGLLSKGLMGMVWGYLYASLLSFTIESYFLTRVLKRQFIDFFKSFIPELIASSLLLLILVLGKTLVTSTGTFFQVKYVVFHFIWGIAAILFYLFILNKTDSRGISILRKNFYEKWKTYTSSHAR